MDHPETPQRGNGGPGRDLVICLFLVVSSLAAYWQVSGHGFVAFDDREYVTVNEHVKAGLTAAGVHWAFTTPSHAHNWHPLTWLSHMLDCQLYGLEPAGHHLTNLALHVLNAVLVFLVFRKMTGAVWRSGFVAALFALHPLHVESVAWVAERKDVLSTCFWLLTMWAYVHYVRRGRARWYWLSVLLFALGLMAKPMLVTLPFVLLLLDYWPLQRLEAGRSTANGVSRWWTGLRLLREKAPFFVLAAVSCVMTVRAQQQVIKSEQLYPLAARVGNAVVSYVSYMGKMVWPTRLSIFYPHRGEELTVWPVVGATLLLVGLTVLALRLRRRYLITGWLWYLGTLVPVIGLVQVGMQGMADRYTYIPLIGLFVIVVWGLGDLLARWRYRRAVLTALGAAVLLVCGAMTRSQVSHWKDSVALFGHAAEAIEDNAWAHYNLGLALRHREPPDHGQALVHFQETVRIDPTHAEAWGNAGVLLAERGDLDAAIAHLSEEARLLPEDADAHRNLGLAYARQGEFNRAVAALKRVTDLRPDDAGTYYLIARLHAELRQADEAVAQLRQAVARGFDDQEALQHDRVFDGIRGSAAFQALMGEQ